MQIARGKFVVLGHLVNRASYLQVVEVSVLNGKARFGMVRAARTDDPAIPKTHRPCKALIQANFGATLLPSGDICYIEHGRILIFDHDSMCVKHAVRLTYDDEAFIDDVPRARGLSLARLDQGAGSIGRISVAPSLDGRALFFVGQREDQGGYGGRSSTVTTLHRVNLITGGVTEVCCASCPPPRKDVPGGPRVHGPRGREGGYEYREWDKWDEKGMDFADWPGIRRGVEYGELAQLLGPGLRTRLVLTAHLPGGMWNHGVTRGYIYIGDVTYDDSRDSYVVDWRCVEVLEGDWHQYPCAMSRIVAPRARDGPIVIFGGHPRSVGWRGGEREKAAAAAWRHKVIASFDEGETWTSIGTLETEGAVGTGEGDAPPVFAMSHSGTIFAFGSRPESPEQNKGNNALLDQGRDDECDWPEVQTWRIRRFGIELSRLSLEDAFVIGTQLGRHSFADAQFLEVWKEGVMPYLFPGVPRVDVSHTQPPGGATSAERGETSAAGSSSQGPKRESSPEDAKPAASGKRKRVRWSESEEAQLRAGVAELGEGAWAKILKQFSFDKCRTNVDLKDKWRNLNK